jgi:hypothetical protein
MARPMPRPPPVTSAWLYNPDTCKPPQEFQLRAGYILYLKLLQESRDDASAKSDSDLPRCGRAQFSHCTIATCRRNNGRSS